MGKEEVKHSHHNAEHHKHPDPRRSAPSKFSLFKHRVADLFKEIVEDVPEEPKLENKIGEVEPEGIENGIRITAEANSAPEKEAYEVSRIKEKEVIKDVEIDEELTREEMKQQEREEMRQRIHEHIVGNLNSAVSKWKETGDLGVHIEPPVPLKDKVKSFLSKVKEKSSPVAAKLKSQIEEVAEKVSARLKKAEHAGEKVDADVVVKEEWTKVLKKLDGLGNAAERDEIEKIYKQLSSE
jgi:putative NIF3 family GTP cyclohydrolase 1 type 2